MSGHDGGHAQVSTAALTLGALGVISGDSGHPDRALRRPEAGYRRSQPDLVPPALVSNLFHNHVLHERVLLVGVETVDQPRADEVERAEVTDLGEGFHRGVLRFGFMEEPEVTGALSRLAEAPSHEVRDRTTFFLGRETVIVSSLRGMAPWREKLVAVQLRTAATAPRFFNLPADRVFEVGAHVEI